MSIPTEFGQLDNSKLGSLVLELASQLHIERTRRLALEVALTQRGIVKPSDIDAASVSPIFRGEAEQAADLAIRKLLRVLSQSPDERVPLRAESPPDVAGEES
jgi:hypothetical protein